MAEPVYVFDYCTTLLSHDDQSGGVPKVNTAVLLSVV